MIPSEATLRARRRASEFGPEFSFALENTIAAEGLFSDHDLDPGGATRYGITEAVARRHGYKFDMRVLPVEIAVLIYYEKYWQVQHLSKVRSRYIAAEIFDTSVNAGPWWGGAITQSALVLFGHDVAVDGRIGPATLAAINSELPKYERHLYAALNGMQFVKYAVKWRMAFRAVIAIVRRADSDHRRAFIRGWMRRVSAFPEMSQWGA